jgi:hypothetical protein
MSSILITSCKKETKPGKTCFPNSSTVRYITNQQATIKVAGGQFYIVEKNAIDTKLNPCNLAKEYLVANLQVSISGEVKSTIHNGMDPCCTENFVITHISQ